MKHFLLALGCCGFLSLFPWGETLAQQDRDLSAFFSLDNTALPAVSGHRGGRFYRLLPENSIAVFQHVASNADAYIECDVTMSADSVLFLLHDRELDRTTNGTGEATSKAWSYLSSLLLVDDFGTVTEEKIPTLKETIDWARDAGVILALDLKDLPAEYLARKLSEWDCEEDVLLIAYTLEQAIELHQLAPEYVMSVSISSFEELEGIKESGIPLDQLVAFTGTSLPTRELIDAIHALDIPTIMGTMTDQDKAFREEKMKTNPYGPVIWHGVMILATDHPVEAYGLIRNAGDRRGPSMQPPSSSDSTKVERN